MNGASLPSGPFGCILADPPWRFVTYDGRKAVASRTSSDPYPTMAISALRTLPVERCAATDCALFMWGVGAHLYDAIDLSIGWGFDYKTDAFVWDKGRMGMGYWTRKESETCLLFTRGKPKRLSRGVRQIIRAPRREHSRKPDEQYERIEALVSGPYLELFARHQRPGWACWGNETDKFGAAA